MGGTYGSRTAELAGSAAFLASRAVRDKATRVAAHLLEVAPADVVLDDGHFAVRGYRKRAVSWAKVAAAAHAGMGAGRRA